MYIYTMYTHTQLVHVVLFSTTRTNCYTHTHTYSIPPDDGLQICPKHVEVD